MLLLGIFGLVLSAMIGYAIAVRGRRTQMLDGMLIAFAVPGVLGFLGIAPMALLVLGPESVRRFVSGHWVVGLPIAAAYAAGVLSLVTSPAAVIAARIAGEALPRYVLVTVAISAIGALAYLSYLVYFATHFGI